MNPTDPRMSRQKTTMLCIALILAIAYANASPAQDQIIGFRPMGPTDGVRVEWR